MSKKIFIDTLGCAKNEYDSQNLAAQLLERGCGLADSPEEADILIVTPAVLLRPQRWNPSNIFLAWRH